MHKILLLLAVGMLTSCCSKPGLTVEERAKLDPYLQELLDGQTIAADRYDVTIRPDGTKEYGVIIRTDAPEEVRALGIPVGSVFGDVVTVRVSPEELKLIISLKSVRNIQNSGRNLPH
jgi:hypothetical protein